MGESIEERDAKITHTGRSVEERQVHSMHSKCTILVVEDGSDVRTAEICKFVIE